MQDVSQKGGRTVIFVSHNMTAVKNLCKTGFFLEKGSVKHSGEINYIVNKYLAEASIQGICNNYWNFDDAPGTEKIKIKSAYVQFKEDKITVNTPFEIVTEFWCLEDMDLNINLFLYDINQTCIFSLPSDIEQVVKGKTYKLTFKIPENLMNDGIIKIDFMYVKKQEAIFVHKDALTFEVFENREANGYYGKWIGAVRPTQISRELEEIN